MPLRTQKAALPSELSETMIKQLGSVPEPVEVAWHNPSVARARLELGGRVGGWDAADETLKTLAHMAVAAQVGCSWCLDFNYFLAQNNSMDLSKASQVPRWRQSDVFTPLERDVLEYAEAMTNTPPSVADELYAGSLDQLGLAAMVELTAVIGFANFSTRINIAHGIASQGYSDACKVPLAARQGSFAA